MLIVALIVLGRWAMAGFGSAILHPQAMAVVMFQRLRSGVSAAAGQLQAPQPLDNPLYPAGWGLLERIAATNCPPTTSCVMDLGDFPLIGTDLAVDGIALGYGPRRSVVDTILVEAAIDAGAEVRTGVNVEGFTAHGDRITGIRGRRSTTGTVFTESATIVVGADGRRSRVARMVAAPEYESVPPLTCWYFSYWSGVPDRGVEIYIRPDRVAFAFPTNDALVGIFVGWRAQCLPAVRADVERSVTAAIDDIPDLSERVRAGRREEPFRGATDVPNFFRKPHGRGWALVGDAGCHKDPILALGMCDALRDAEFLVDALDDGLSGRRPFAEALEEFERRRNEASAADYRENLHLASFQPPPAETYRLRAAIRNDADATRQFFLARQQMIPPAHFFNQENLQRLLGTVPDDAGPRGPGVRCGLQARGGTGPPTTPTVDTTAGTIRRVRSAPMSEISCSARRGEPVCGTTGRTSCDTRSVRTQQGVARR